MKSIYTLFLLLVLSATMFPLGRVGWLLGSNNLTEEVNGQNDKAFKKSNLLEDFPIGVNPEEFFRDAITPVNVILNNRSAMLPLNPCYEIVGPPPDFFC